MLQLLEKFRFPSDYSDPPYSIYPESVCCRAKPFDRGDQSEYSRTTPSFIPPQLPGNQFYRPFKGKFPDFIAHSRSFCLPFGMVIFGNEGIVRTPFRLRRIQDRSKNFPMKFRPVMHSLWFQYNAEFISRIEKFILLARQIVFSSCALLSHNGNLTQIPTRENDARELSFPPVLIEK